MLWKVLFEMWKLLFEILLDSPDILSVFLTGVGVIAAVVAAIAASVTAGGIIYVARQFKFTGWMRAQDIFTKEKFTEARTKVLGCFGFQEEIAPYIGEEMKKDALIVC